MITNESIQDFLRCQYKAYLRIRHTHGKKTEYEMVENECLRRFATQFYQNLHAKYRPEQICREIPRQRSSSPLDTRYVLEPSFQSPEYTISFHALKILPQKQFPQKLTYLPIDVVSREKLSTLEKRALAIKCALMSQLSPRVSVEYGQILHGRTLKGTKITLAKYAKDTRHSLKELTSLIHTEEAPRFYRNAHCAVCEFQAHCTPQLIEKDDLSLLGGMSPKEILKKNNRGIFTVRQFSYTFRPRRRKRKDSGAKPCRCEWALKALALREQRTYLQDIPTLPNTETEVFVDFEGLPDENVIYLIGMIIKHNEVEQSVSFWADSAQEEELIFTQFFDTLSPFREMTIYHYGSYEVHALKRFKKKSQNAKAKDIDHVIDCMVNILSFFTSTVYPPTYTNGLKDIAQFLGFAWSEKNASGLQSIVWRKKWEFLQEVTYKQILIQYNAEDCQALQRVREWLGSIHEEIEAESQQDFANVDDIPKENIRKFGVANYQNPDFKAVNKYAYFDYQRSKIYLRTNTHIKKALKKTAHVVKRSNEIDKIVTVRPDRCPYCGHDEFYGYRDASRTVIDLKFLKHGLKKWVTRFDGGKFICRNCEAKVSDALFSHPLHRYGHNLVAWVINQHIAYRVGLNNLQETLLESFGIHVSSTRIYLFKTRMAEQYAETFAEIQRNIVQGHLIHVDETDVAVRGFSSPYVWAFTNMESVCFQFRPNREAAFLKELLHDFAGVLVSDFYAGYDTLPCLQQKCLIHLMRDMNNDLLRNQLDQEYKGMVMDFGKLLRTIMITVDKYGLKKYHLQKHVHDVDAFYRKTLKTDYESELAAKYQARFEKNHGKLFTFLHHDGIPWNNNNAEHTIKSFAHYRMLNDGRFTEQSLTEYLILLSIQQTCRYRGISFLEFLRSGEKSIDTFARSVLP